MALTKYIFALIVSFVLVTILVMGTEASPQMTQPTPTPSATATRTPRPSPTRTATKTPVLTATPIPTATPVVVPLNTIYFDVDMTSELANGGRFVVQLDPYDAITDVSPNNYELDVLTGYIDPSHIGPQVWSGVRSDWSGFQAYFYTTALDGITCGPYTTLTPDGHGCLGFVPNYTPATNGVVTIEDDYNTGPTWNGWTYWLLDTNETGHEIASFSTAIGTLTEVTAETSIHYAEPTNPEYIFDTVWIHPRGYIPTMIPYYFDFAGGYAHISWTNPADSGVCLDGVAGYLFLRDQHTWNVGSANENVSSLICEGDVWPR